MNTPLPVNTRWRSGQVKNLANVTLGKMLQSSNSGDDILANYMRAANVQPDGVLMLDSKQMWFRTTELDSLSLRRGDVVVVEGGVGGYGRAAYLQDDLVGWGFQNSINRLRPHTHTDGRFLAYYLIAVRAAGFVERYCNIVSMPHLTAEKLGALPVPMPDFDEQSAIADYLDRETARIDTLIEEQQRLIELLRERRQAKTNTELGIRVGTGERLKWCLREVDVRAGEVPETLPLMSVSIDWGVRRRDEVTGEEARAENLFNHKVARQGDLVINRMRAFQGALGVAPEDGVVSPDYAVLQKAGGVSIEWLAATMKTEHFVSEMAGRIKGIGSAELGTARTPRINVPDLLDIRLNIPAIEVQKAEVEQIRGALIQIDTLIVETETFIELARERRSALITAAVTGQIDVREVA